MDFESLKDVYQGTINKNPKMANQNDRLTRNLKDSFTDWQFFSDGKQGLNSGGIGQVFTRLLGSGIMEDMPETGELPYNSTGYGVKVIKAPTNEEDIGNINVLTYIDNGNNNIVSLTFKFSTSLNSINERIKKLEDELNK